MKNTLTLSYIVLLFFTLIVAFVASGGITPLAVKVILMLSLAKFLIVGWQFMELKHAHSFWKVLLGAFAGLMGVIGMVLL